MKNTFMLKIGLYLIFSLIAQSVVAEDSPADSRTGSDSVILDHEITDIRMRTQSGAQSKWSSSLYLNYAGASLSHPWSDARPNPEGYAVPEPVSAAGNIGLRYRLNKNKSLYLATGFYQVRPMHQSKESSRIEVNTPQLIFNDTFAAGKFQLSQSLLLYYTTQDYLRDVGDQGSMGYSLGTVYNFEQTKWRAGLSILLRSTFFDLNSETVRTLQSDYGLSLTPSLQYDYNQKVNFFTSVNLLGLNHFRSEKNAFDMSSLPISQSFGVGIAFLRDFYFAPNLNFDPQRLSRHNTSVNFNLNVNL